MTLLKSGLGRLLAASVWAGLAGTLGCSGEITDVGQPIGPPVSNPPVTMPPVAKLCASSKPSVGVAPLRRLTRSQYNHSVRDLLGITGDPAAKMTIDEKVGPFYSNASASVTELLAEQLMNASETLADQAMARISTLAPCDQGGDQAACGAKFVDTFGLRSFRRPLLTEERSTLVGLFEAGRKDEGYEGGVKRVIQTVLQSPQFLYHLELGAAPAGSPEVVALDQYKVASRLSFYIWDSTPDPELLRAAGANELNSPDALRAQATRLLNDVRAGDTIASFHKQWLGMDQLAILEKDASVYPAYNTTLRDSMINEAARFTDYVIRSGDGKLDTLLTAPFSFIDAPLAKLYGVTVPANADPSKPYALDPAKRSGLLTLPGVLAVHAHAEQSSPIRRGKLVREQFFCQTLSPPPPEVNASPPMPDPNASTRDRFEMHRSNPSCAACHTLIDPLGFGFENYDGIGAFRNQEAGKLIDASGEISGTDVDGKFNGVLDLAKKLASSEQVRDCVAEKWFNYGFGRTAGEADTCSLEAMSQALAKSNNIRDLLLALVTTDAFRYGRFEKGAP